MASLPLYPYPRLDRHVLWSPTAVLLNGESVDIDLLADQWDSESEITLSIGATVSTELLRSKEFLDAQLVLRAGCKETSSTKTSRANFADSGGTSYADCSVTLNGAELAQQLEIRAVLQAPHGNTQWLSRRIIAERRVEKIGLDSALFGFPTTAISFLSENWPAMPWRLTVTASSLSDTFVHSIRLMLNVDYPRVNELIEGRAQPYVEAALRASITRIILTTARRFADEESDDGLVENVVAERPDSFAAAADKTCRDYLRRPLIPVLSLLRSRPESVEDLILEAVGFLKE